MNDGSVVAHYLFNLDRDLCDFSTVAASLVIFFSFKPLMQLKYVQVGSAAGREIDSSSRRHFGAFALNGEFVSRRQQSECSTLFRPLSLSLSVRIHLFHSIPSPKTDHFGGNREKIQGQCQSVPQSLGGIRGR